MRASLFLLAVLSVSAAVGDVLFVEPLGTDGVMVKVDVFKAIDKMKAMKSETIDEYVVTLNRPKAGSLYSDVAEGVSDAPVLAYSNTVKKGIFQAVGDSISDNPWKWAIGAGAAVFGVYKVGDSYGWWDRGGDEGAPRMPNVQTGDNSPVIIIVNNDNSRTDYDAPISSETPK